VPYQTDADRSLSALTCLALAGTLSLVQACRRVKGVEADLVRYLGWVRFCLPPHLTLTWWSA